MSHDQTIQLLAREFEELPPQLRMELRDLCNTGNASGNVRKGVQKLDTLLKGKLLRDKEFELRMNVRTEGAEAGYKSKVVNPAVAGATRKYGIIKK